MIKLKDILNELEVSNPIINRIIKILLKNRKKFTTVLNVIGSDLVKKYNEEGRWDVTKGTENYYNLLKYLDTDTLNKIEKRLNDELKNEI